MENFSKNGAMNRYNKILIIVTIFLLNSSLIFAQNKIKPELERQLSKYINAINGKDVDRMLDFTPDYEFDSISKNEMGEGMKVLYSKESPINITFDRNIYYSIDEIIEKEGNLYARISNPHKINIDLNNLDKAKRGEAMMISFMIKSIVSQYKREQIHREKPQITILANEPLYALNENNNGWKFTNLKDQYKKYFPEEIIGAATNNWIRRGNEVSKLKISQRTSKKGKKELKNMEAELYNFIKNTNKGVVENIVNAIPDFNFKLNDKAKAKKLVKSMLLDESLLISTKFDRDSLYIIEDFVEINKNYYAKLMSKLSLTLNIKKAGYRTWDLKQIEEVDDLFDLLSDFFGYFHEDQMVNNGRNPNLHSITLNYPLYGVKTSKNDWKFSTVNLSNEDYFPSEIVELSQRDKARKLEINKTKEILKELEGNIWFGKKKVGDEAFSMFSYFKFNESFEFQTLNFPYKSWEKDKLHKIEKYSDSVIKFAYNKSRWGNMTLTKQNSKTESYFLETIRKDSIFAPTIENIIPDDELSRFWQQNIIPIIDLDEEKIKNTAKFDLFNKDSLKGYQLSMGERFYGARNFWKWDDETILKSRFPKELRTSLKKLNIDDIQQNQLSNNEVILILNFYGKKYHTVYTNRKKITVPAVIEEFKLAFQKFGDQWKLIDLSLSEDVEYYYKGNIDIDRNKSYEVSRFQRRVIGTAISNNVKSKLNSNAPISELFEFPVIIEDNNANEIDTTEILNEKDLTEWIKTRFNNNFFEVMKKQKLGESAKVYLADSMTLSITFGVDPEELENVKLFLHSNGYQWKISKLKLD